VSFPVLKFTQPAGDFSLTCLTATEVTRIARAEPRQYDQQTHRTRGGVQREASRQRVAEIAEYCRTLDAAFPTAIILSVPDENYKLSKTEDRIDFTGKPPFADIVDGQHRLLGLSRSNATDKFLLPVVLLLDATEEQEALLFATINGKQTKVSASLIYELFEVTEGRSPQKTAHEIARVMNSKKESPWYERLKMLGRRTREDSNETITQGTFVRELLLHMSSNPPRDFDSARRGQKLPPDPENPIFRKYFEAEQDEVIVRVLINLFSAQRETWPEEWGDPTRSILTKSTGFMATMWSLREIVGHGQGQRDLSKDMFRRIFRNVKRRLDRDRMPLVADSFPSSGQGIRRLRDLFIAGAERDTTR